MTENTGNRTTKNIRLATVWLALGAKYEGVDRKDKSHQEFQFSAGNEKIEVSDGKRVIVQRDVDLDMIEKQLANRELVINAHDLFDAFQQMKSIIHSS